MTRKGAGASRRGIQKNNILRYIGRVLGYRWVMDDDHDIRRGLVGALQILREQQEMIDELRANGDALLEVLRSLVPSFDTVYQSLVEPRNETVSLGHQSSLLNVIDHAIGNLNNQTGQVDEPPGSNGLAGC